MDELVRSVMHNAPEVMHHVYALEGANEVLLALETDECKAAYLIRITAVILFKAGVALDPTIRLAGPNEIQFHIKRSDPFFSVVPYEITALDLADFEDLYYATWAQINIFLHQADLLITNGFKQAQDKFFHFLGEPLLSLGPIKLGDFRACLIAQQRLLQGTQMTTLLETSLRLKGSHDQTSDPRGGSHPNQMNPSHQISLSKITSMSSGMIFAHLAEKHRTSRLDIHLEGFPATRNLNREHATTYISPYNLDERAKRLNRPGRPELPCICDPDCICAPLCASDPQSNCLCEENGLFARVTQGVDIDELDVPDLVRRRRQSSECSSYSGTSTYDEGHADRDVGPGWQRYLEPSIDERDTVGEATNQVYNQEDGALTRFDPSDASDWIKKDTHTLPDESDFEPSSTQLAFLAYGEPFISPPRSTSLSYQAYQEALVRPFAVQCDTPPRRQITRRANVARRLFSGTGNDIKIPWRTSSAIGSGNSIGASGGVTKSGTKSASVILPALKQTFRRSSMFGGTS